ncbi:hypothetical protein MTO96_009832 [Rhipicephalus appendiculatus]
MKAPGLEDAKKLRIALIAGNEQLERDDFLSDIVRLWPWGQLGAQKQAWLSFLPVAAPVLPPAAAVPVCAVAKSLAAAATRALLYDALPQSAASSSGFSSGDTLRAHRRRMMPDGRSRRMCVAEGMKARRQNLGGRLQERTEAEYLSFALGDDALDPIRDARINHFSSSVTDSERDGSEMWRHQREGLRMLAKDEISSRLQRV